MSIVSLNTSRHKVVGTFGRVNAQAIEHEVKLLSTNTKLDKQNGQSYLITGLALAPHRRSGVNLCPDAGFCSAVCNLWFSGRTVTQPVRQAMLNRSHWFVEDRQAFESKLAWELLQHERKADRLGLIPLVRLNVASDLDWSHVAEQFSGDHVLRLQQGLESNRQDTKQLPSDLLRQRAVRLANGKPDSLSRGFNVSMVFDTEYCPQHGRIGELPTDIKLGTKWWPVTDGDKHDIRIPEMDGHGVIVGLRFKGSRKLLGQAIEHGFVFAG